MMVQYFIFLTDGISLSVDGQEYGRVAPPDGGFKNYKTECPSMATEVSRWVSKMAPFDQEVIFTNLTYIAYSIIFLL